MANNAEKIAKSVDIKFAMNITSIIRKSELSNNKYNIINIPEYTNTHISLFVNNVSKSAIIIILIERN